MKTIELSAAMASAPVQENLKNFAGLDAQNALGLMTPERLAAVAGGILCSRFGLETTELATFKTNTCRYSRDTKVWDAVTDKPTELTLLTEGSVLTIGADDYRTQVLFNNSMLCADSIFVRYERAKGFGEWRKI